MKPLDDEVIKQMYRTGTRNEYVGNVADPTQCITWTWSIGLPEGKTVHIQIRVIWDVELLYAIDTSDWIRVSNGHESDFEQLVQDTWGRLEDLWLKDHTYEDDDVIKGWH